MFLLRWIFVSLAVVLVPLRVAQADLIIDDFTTPQSVSNSGGFGGSTPGSGIFGGARVVNLQVTNSTQQLEITSVTQRLDLSVTPTNPLFFNTMTLTYSDPVPSLDLGVANAHSFSLADVQAAGPWTLTVTLNGTSSATAAMRTVPIADGFSSQLVIPFNAFDNSVLGLGSISKITLHFNNDSGAAPTLSFGPATFLTAVAVPETSVMLLATASMVAVLVHKRKLRLGRGAAL